MSSTANPNGHSVVKVHGNGSGNAFVESPTSIEPNALDLVEDIIRRIRANGGVLDAQGIWGLNSEDPLVPNLDQPRYAQWMKSAKQNVELSSRVADTLSLLHKIVAEERDASRSEMIKVASQCGVRALPDELLLHIFTLVWATSWQNPYRRKDILAISAVCVRFRKIVISTSKFWSHISSSMDPNAVDMCLVRSRDAALDIYDECNEIGPHQSALFQEKVLPHCYRWESFHLGYTNCSERTARATRKKLTGLHLPLLREFHMDFPGIDDVGEDFRDGELHVYQSWNAPLLQAFTAGSMIPRASNGFHLKTCEVEIGSFAWLQPRDALATLMNFLASQPTLEKFFFSIVSFPQEASSYPSSSRLHLPSLKVLSLGIHYEYWAYEDGEDDDGTSFIIPTILIHLAMPNLESLDIDFLLPRERLPGFSLSDLFPRFNSYALLETLNLTIHHAHTFTYRMSPFKVIFDKMPNLKHLYMKIYDSHVTGIVPDSHASVPPLRTLHLQDCKRFDEKSLLAVLRFLSRAQSWTEFEELRITDCPLLVNCADKIASILPPGKVKVMEG